jgi:hypothetical protein
MKNILNACLILFLISASTAIYSQDTNKIVGYGMTSGRAKSLVGVGIGIISVIIGGSALSRSSNRVGKSAQTKATVALVLGLIGIVLGLVHLSNNPGNFGTGGGRAGAIVALVVGVTGMVLGGLALARHKRNTNEVRNIKGL